MFTSLLFLILILLMSSLASEALPVALTPPPWQGFVQGTLLYGLTLFFIAFQSRLPLRRTTLLFLGQMQLVLVVFLFLFVVLGQRVLGTYATPVALLAICSYFMGLFLLHYTLYGKEYARQQVRLLAAFVLPYLAFCLLADLVTLIPADSWIGSWLYSPHLVIQLLALALFAMLFLFATLAWLPPLMMKLWQCQPLPYHERLEAICQRTQFRHGGMMTWPVMRGVVSAAIVGLLPHYRYVIFSQRLLDEMPEPYIETVLAHEIGHSKRRHLFLYPFILLGAVGLIGLYVSWSQQPLSQISTVVVVGAIMALYFRFVYGYFSRLFERQADLYPLEIGLPAENIIGALDSVGTLSGHIHLQPSWHHHSIQQRIDFLRVAAQDPSLIAKHHRLVRVSLIVYTLLLILIMILIANEQSS